ncbi:hypothetical protein J6590_044695 [Homalodisca vitripennis]|nr:hypothetical protein J6590_044695 [Homalodisca vitripennis]
MDKSQLYNGDEKKVSQEQLTPRGDDSVALSKAKFESVWSSDKPNLLGPNTELTAFNFVRLFRLDKYLLYEIIERVRLFLSTKHNSRTTYVVNLQRVASTLAGCMKLLIRVRLFSSTKHNSLTTYVINLHRVASTLAGCMKFLIRVRLFSSTKHNSRTTYVINLHRVTSTLAGCMKLLSWLETRLTEEELRHRCETEMLYETNDGGNSAEDEASKVYNNSV